MNLYFKKVKGFWQIYDLMQNLKWKNDGYRNHIEKIIRAMIKEDFFFRK